MEKQHKPSTPKQARQVWRKVPCALRGRLHEFQGAKLHVWLCHLLHTNTRNESWPSLETIRDMTGFSERSILPARRSLVEGGWLQRVSKGQPRNGTRFASPHFRVLIPSERKKAPHGKKGRFRAANTSGFRTAKTSDRRRETEGEKREGDAASLSAFDSFWQAYPKKVGKPSATRAWKKVKKGEIEQIMQGLGRWKLSDQWQDAQYIPHPSTFLNDRRWQDEPAKAGKDHSKLAWSPSLEEEESDKAGV